MFLSLATLRPCSAIRTSLRRTLFTLPNLPSLGDLASGSRKYTDEKIFPYTEKELYSVVADVASYPQFIPFCLSSRIDKDALQQAMQQKTVVDAEMTVGFMGFKESYVSKVTCVPYKSVQACASSATPLFKELSTTWEFHKVAARHRTSPQMNALDDPNIPTLVKFDLTYQFANPLHAGVSSTFFGKVSQMMIQAFEDRCLDVYGPRKRT